MDEQTHTTEENVPNQTEENKYPSGKEINGQVDFSQMYDMLTERDETIKNLQSEVAELKKTNTNLLLKVNASPSGDSPLKTPYEGFVDSMVNR